MKTLLITLLLSASVAEAHVIKGTLILKGTAKTKVQVDGIESKCSVKVDDVKNTLTEDSFGNPAYRVWTKVELSGKAGELKIEHKADLRFTNIQASGTGTVVSDENYIGETEKRASLKIDEKGRIRSVVFPVGAKSITCTF
jgi:hypothetical protein